MSQYPGGQQPQDPYYGQQQPGNEYPQAQGGDPYAPPPPSDPYFGQSPGDPYAQQQGQPTDWWQNQAQADAYAQQQAWYAQQQQTASERDRTDGGRGSTGAVIVGIFLVGLGVWFLFRDEIAIDISTVWPIVAVALGIVMVIGAFIPRRASS